MSVLEAEAVWSHCTQRESCGLRDQRRVIAHLGIPRSVLVRLGARWWITPDPVDLLRDGSARVRLRMSSQG
ncbi:MAG: hypothetical protein ACKOEY_02320 [Phenylobacterium sp.]